MRIFTNGPLEVQGELVPIHLTIFINIFSPKNSAMLNSFLSGVEFGIPKTISTVNGLLWVRFQSSRDLGDVLRRLAQRNGVVLLQDTLVSEPNQIHEGDTRTAVTHRGSLLAQTGPNAGRSVYYALQLSHGRQSLLLVHVH